MRPFPARRHVIVSRAARGLATPVVILCLATCAHAALPHTGDARIDADLTRLRAATQPFQSLDTAVAAGYPREVPDCLVHEHHGAMGYHHVNRATFSATPSIERPQILLYERRDDGSYRLNGVEFIVPYRLLARDATPPVLFGQAMHREDNLSIWYLHVWAWRPNPDGVFANFHPDVRCPGGGKVYTPFERAGPGLGEAMAPGTPARSGG